MLIFNKEKFNVINMSDNYYDPLFEKFLKPKELKDFTSKESIKNLVNEKSISKVKQNSTVELANQTRIIDLDNNHSYQKILVGSYGDKSFYALVDRKSRICKPIIER